MMGNFYDSMGRYVGRTDGNSHYDALGRYLGRTNGTSHYDALGNYLGRSDDWGAMPLCLYY